MQASSKLTKPSKMTTLSSADSTLTKGVKLDFINIGFSVKDRSTGEQKTM